jgi:hypothetical protein
MNKEELQKAYEKAQFSLDEIIKGTAWRMVLENAQRPTLDY